MRYEVPPPALAVGILSGPWTFLPMSRLVMSTYILSCSLVLSVSRLETPFSNPPEKQLGEPKTDIRSHRRPY